MLCLAAVQRWHETGDLVVAQVSVEARAAAAASDEAAAAALIARLCLDF